MEESIPSLERHESYLAGSNVVQYPRFVGPSYAIAFGYCFADAASATYDVMSEDDARVVSDGARSREVRAAIAFTDTLLWQGKNAELDFARCRGLAEISRRKDKLTSSISL